jgi:hypothetical protein
LTKNFLKKAIIFNRSIIKYKKLMRKKVNIIIVEKIMTKIESTYKISNGLIEQINYKLE